MFVLDRHQFDRLLPALADRGFRVRGPRLRDGAVVYDDVATSADLPAGVTDETTPGRCRLHSTDGAALFGTRVGPASWKREFTPPEAVLWSARRTPDGLAIETARDTARPVALIGVRPCDLAALGVQDRVLGEGPHADPVYAARRAAAFVVAVQCTEPADTCFCASLGTGPAAGDGFDIVLTELADGGAVRYLADAGSERGADVLRELDPRAAGDDEVRAAAAALRRAAGRMGRRLDPAAAAEALRSAPEHPRWDAVGERCLACGNCTAVCPTCFCHTVVDVTSIDGARAERVRREDSCFTLEFSYLHGGSVRTERGTRYRHWLTHKLATWIDQFGEPGCVGCGRCIVWCPVGIDLTEEVRALRPAPARPAEVEGQP